MDAASSTTQRHPVAFIPQISLIIPVPMQIQNLTWASFVTLQRLKYHTQIHVRSTRGRNKVGRKITGIEPLPGENKVTSPVLCELLLTLQWEGGYVSNSVCSGRFWLPQTIPAFAFMTWGTCPCPWSTRVMSTAAARLKPASGEKRSRHAQH